MNKPITDNTLVAQQKRDLTNVFSQFILSACGAPPEVMGEDVLKAFLERTNLKAGANEDGSVFLVVQEGGTQGGSQQIASINVNRIVELMQQNNPAVILANKFNGREYGNVISLEDAMLLNSKGYIVITPKSDNLINVYGIGSEAKTIDDQTLEFGALYTAEEPVDHLFLVPATTNAAVKVLNEEEFAKLEEARYRLQRVFENVDDFCVGKITTFNCPARGYVIDVENTTLNHCQFEINEEGDRYGTGLVIELP